MSYTRDYNLLSWASSTATGGAVFVGDARTVSLSLQTVTTASTYTIQGSNDNGFTAAIVQWSTVTTMTVNGATILLNPGQRWYRAQQAASSSSATLRLSLSVAVR